MLPNASYLSEDTIGALSTELGGAIAIVRVSGPAAFASLEKISQSHSIAFQSPPRKMVRAQLQQLDQLLDDALVVRFVGPSSYTGEDMVEYHLHGGSYIAQRVLEVLLLHGVRQALPGEFSFRSVRNGKLTLFQAQAVADLISARNDAAVGLALEKLQGSQNVLLEKLAKDLRQLAALGEVGIDFADQDVEEVSLPHLKLRITDLLSLLTTLEKSYQRGIKLQEGIKVVFAGPPNAGKSSFFNALLGEDRSIVSETAGTTRDVVREKLTLRGNRTTLTFRLEDTAGLRGALDPIEKMGIERTFRAAQNSDLILFLVDSTTLLPSSPQHSEAKTQWEALSQSLQQGPKRPAPPLILGVLTKSDLTSDFELATALKEVQSWGIQTVVGTSAITGKGIQEAIDTLIHLCEGQTRRLPGELILTRLDHHRAVVLGLEHLRRAEKAAEIDLFASDVRQTLGALGPLIGETLPDDILGKIFSDFCIGK